MDFQQLTWTLCRAYVEDLDSATVPGRDRVLGWIRSRSLPQVASCSSQFPDAKSREEVRAYMQIESFFKKNASFATPEVDETTVKNFRLGERICRITNKRLDHYYIERGRLAPDLEKWMSVMEREIDRILGSFETFLDEIPELVRLTAGASSTRSRRNALPPMKLGKTITATIDAVKYLSCLASSWGYDDIRFDQVVANRVEFVPKNWKTGRGIACEPDGNLPLQLAFDSYAKKRLRRKAGVDLSTQSLNQELAKHASIHDDLATVDLSMASDTLAYNTVAWLLPREWFDYLVDVRCPCYRLPDGTWGGYAKFSSMGNGATFALETLVFTCAAIAVGSKRYSVYGDDLIIESELVDDLKRLLSFLGFSLNSEKSFVRGPFRESCGGNYYEGVDITPFYVRDLDSRKAVLCHLVNGLAGVSLPGGLLWDLLLDLVLSEGLPTGPWCEDSMAYVWVSAHHAYESGKISLHKKQHYLRVKAYRQATEPVRFNRESLRFLWHLGARKGRIQLNGVIREIYEWRETRRYSRSTHKYVKCWRRWQPPTEAAPVHLWWWSDMVIARA